MLRYTFRQMRASLRSLVAVSTAVIVSTGFVAAALIGSSAMTDALYNMVSAKYAGADLVVYPPAARIVPPIGAADAASAVEGIEAARPLLSAWIEARTEGHSEWVEVTEATRSERLNPQPVTEGHEPAGADEASLGAQFAKRLGVGIGDQFEFVVETFTEPVQADTEPPADDAAGAGGEDGSADEGAGSGETSPADSASATGGDDNNTDGGAGETASDTDSAVGTVGEDRGANEGAGETASDTDSDTEGGGDETSVDQWDTTEVTVVVTVSGLFDDSGPTLWSQPGVQAAPEVLDALGAGEVFGPFWWDSLAVAAAEGADLAPGSGLRVALGEAIAAAAEAVQVEDDFTCESGIGVDALGPTDAYSYPSCEVQVLDMDQQSAKTITEFMGGVAILTAVVLIFGLIGLLVAAMAISNTYQVLIAGRTRTLALMRAVGATQKQVRRTVLLEGLFMGVGGSVVGIGLGWGLVQAALAVAGGLYPTLPLPEHPRITWLAALVAIVAGVVTTLLASLVPARLASRVPPVAALRPLSPPKLATKSGRGRLWVSVGLSALGLGMLGAGVAINSSIDLEKSGSGDTMLVGSAIGVLGGGLLVVGVLAGSVFWLPKVVSLVAGLLGRLGGAARIASANAVRNPSRTAAAAAALMVGVTLVTSLVVAADSVGASLNREVSRYSPIQVRVGQAPYLAGTTQAEAKELAGWESFGPSVPEGLINEIMAVRGVEAYVPVHAGYVGLETDLAHPDGGTPFYPAFAVDREGLEEVVWDQDFVDSLRPGTVLISGWLGAEFAPMDSEDSDPPYSDLIGTAQRLIGTDGQAVERELVLRSEYESILPYEAIITDLDTLRELGAVGQESGAAVGGAADAVPEVWFKLADSADQADVVDQIQDIVTEHTGVTDANAFMVWGSAAERAAMEQVLDTMVLIGLALLAVSIIVALVGVSNTLWLSVLERARETAMLRALGLTRRETRRMMALEGVIISGVAGLTGVALGVFFGLAGCGLLFSATDFMSLAVPVGRVAAVLAIAVLTGLIASILPGRRAAKTPPAAALAAAE